MDEVVRKHGDCAKITNAKKMDITPGKHLMSGSPF